MICACATYRAVVRALKCEVESGRLALHQPLEASAQAKDDVASLNEEDTQSSKQILEEF